MKFSTGNSVLTWLKSADASAVGRLRLGIRPNGVPSENVAASAVVVAILFANVRLFSVIGIVK